MAAGADETAPPERPPEERYGVLAIDRRHKDDGRALTLYSHEEDAHETDGEAALESGANAAARSGAGAEVKPSEAGE
jgi:hypothetical protein